jgi:hypothetical protein
MALGMSTLEDVHVDFMHVSTYLPMIFQLLRASVFLTLLEAVLLVQQHFAMLLAVTALIAYLDGRTFQHERLNRACGFLVPAGLIFCVNKAMLLQFTACTLSNTMRVLYYVLATAWATCGLGMLGMLSLDSLGNVQSRVSENTFILVSGFLGVANVYVDCASKPMYELLLRVGLFYLATTSFILLHSTSQRTHRTVYESVGKHITMHILFVDAYVVAASIFLFLVFHVYVIQTRCRQKNASAPTTTMPAKVQDHARLASVSVDEAAINELLAAKRAVNMV